MATTALKGAHLSLQQNRLWSFQQGSSAYCSQCALLLKGTLDRRVLQQALRQIVERYTLFQTVFSALPGMDVPIQILGQPMDFVCPLISLEALPAPLQRALLHTLFTQLRETSFDLARGPLFQTTLLPLSARETFLFINLPALYADASTLPLFVRELGKRYQACLSGQEWDVELLQYTAVSSWQKQQHNREDAAARTAREFWNTFALSQIASVQQLLLQANILKDQSANERAVFEPLTSPLLLEEALCMRIHALAARMEMSVTSILLASFLIVLWRLTSEAQLCVGVACDGRNEDALAEVLGLSTRFVPFRGYVQDDWTFERVVTFVERRLGATKQHHISFRWPAVAQTNTRSAPFFPVTFEHEIWPASFPAENVRFELEERWCCTEPFLIKLSVLQVGERLQVECSYDPVLVVAASIPRLVSLLHVFLQDVVEQPKVHVGAFTLLTAAERKQVLELGHGPVRPRTYRGLHRLFEEQVELRPNQLAVRSPGEQLTYQELNSLANRLARVLRAQGVGPNVVVGLGMARSAQMLVGLLAVLKAGGAYLPLDAGNPSAWLVSQLQESCAALLLTQRERRLGEAAWKNRTLCLEDLEPEMRETPARNLEGGSSAEDLAYIIYTSGSTGKPKGVMIQQSSVVNYTLALCELLDAEPGWQYATVSTLAADLGNTAIFCALASGGCVQVLDSEMVMSIEAMTRWVEQHPIDVLKIVPSHLSALVADDSGSKLLPRRALVLGGEVLPARLLERLVDLGCEAQVYNHYGPTETTVGALVHTLGVLGEMSSEKSVPLGRPIANTEVYILDRRMQLVPRVVTGEVYIGREGLARGYVAQPEQTAERFVPNPFVDDVPTLSSHAGARLYRTGDLAHYAQDGQIEFRGRSDQQVKLRGYRIEPGEIETVLRQHPQVRDAAVILREDFSQLVGYVVPRKLPLDRNLGDFLRERVPEYMVPTTFVYLKFLPLTANGKVNRDQLVRASGSENNTLVSLIELDNPTRTILQPRDATEWSLLEIWEEILQKQPLSILDNFFQLGGHSLLAVRLMSHIAKRFGQELPLATLFQHPTVERLAVVLRQHLAVEEHSPLAAIHTQGTRLPFFCVHPAGGTAFCYVNLARRLGPDQPFYGLQIPDLDSIEENLGTIEQIAAYYIAAVQAVQPQGPYLLGGWSAGGVIAFDIAQQLQRQGQEVGVLALIDTSPPDSRERERALAEVVDLTDEGVVKEIIYHFKITTPDDFDQLEIAERFIYAVEQTKKINAIPVDASPELIRRYVCTGQLMKHIVHMYEAHTYPHQIDYFATSQHAPVPNASLEQTASLNEEADEDEKRFQRWRELTTGGMEIHWILGDHQTLVEEPHVQGLANALKQCIDRVCRKPEEVSAE